MAKKVLVIEDEQPIIQALEDTLRKDGFEFYRAVTGPQGLAQALKVHPDVILLDVILPEMNGLSVLKTLREDSWGKDVPVIVFTNMSHPLNVEEAERYGVHDYVIKSNISITDLADKIKACLGEGEKPGEYK